MAATGTVGLRIPSRRILLVVAYLAVVLPTLIVFHVGLVPDVLIFVLLGAAVVAGQIQLFLRDWGVFLLVLILWQHTELAAQWAGFPLQLHSLIDADRWLMQPFLHGALPQVWLQQHLYHAHKVLQHGVWHWVGAQWYDVVSWLVYALHFPEPLLVGFAIWLRDRMLFRRFALAFLTLAALAFVGYIVYPAVPPWLAARAQYRAIPYVYNIFNEFNYWVLQQGLGHADKSLIPIHYNMTAAMPSLHAAFPVLSALYLRKAFGRWGLIMLVYGAIVWFAVVYMAEHWIVDVLAGLLCTLVAYALVEGVAHYLAARRATALQQVQSAGGLREAQADTLARSKQG
jgi:hypothetical protein